MLRNDIDTEQPAFQQYEMAPTDPTVVLDKG